MASRSDPTRRKRRPSTNDAPRGQSVEEALRQSEENYRTVFDNSAVAITVTDADERIVTWNKFAEGLLGMDERDLHMKPVRSLYPKEEWRRIRAQNVRRKGMQHHLETRIIKKSREIIDVDISLSVLKGPEGEVTGSIGIIRDITERRKAEDVIRAQRDLGVSLCHARGLDEGLRLCLEAAIKVSGMDCGGVYLVDEATGALDMAIHQGLPEDFVRTATHFDADSANTRLVMEGDPVYTIHRELGVTLDEARKGAQLRAVAVVPVSDENRVIGCLNVASHTLDEVPSLARDALETIAAQIGSAIARLKAVEALREGEEKWRSLVENSSDFIIILDCDGTILFINHTAPGFTADDTIGKSTYDFIDPKYQSLIRETIDEVCRTGLAGSYETEGAGPHGNLSWYETQIVPLKTEGRVAAVMQISTDITGRKLIEGDEEMVKSAFKEHSGILSSLYLEIEAAKKALHESEERYRYVAETANDAIISIDKHSNVIMWNRRAEETFGYPSEEMIGQPLSLIVPEPSRAGFEQGFRMMVSTGGSDFGALPVETVGLRKDGTEVPVEMSIASWKAGEHVAFTAIVRDITERKRAEEEIKLMALFAELNPAPVLRFDKDGRVLMANKAAHELFGEVLAPGVSLALVLPSVGGLDVAECIRDGAIISHPVDVADRHFLFVFRGVPDLGIGQIYGSDITERKQAEEALQQSEERYRLLAENVTDVIWTMDLNWQCTYISPSVTRQRGFAIEEAMALKPEESLTPASLEVAAKAVEETLALEASGHAESEARPMELEQYCKDGSTIWTEVQATFLRDQNGQPVGILGVGRDITERKRAEEAMRESEERLRTLFETMAEGVIAIAPDGQIVEANLAAERILGLRRSEIEARSYVAPEWEILRADGTPMPPEEMAGPRAMHEKSPVKDVVMGVKRPDNSISWVNVSAAPLLDAAGELRGVVGTFADITERKVAEAERQRIEQQLQLSGRLAAVGELAAGVAHELNNPLAAVQGFAELLTSRKDLDESMQSDVETIYREAKRAAKITSNLLSFARKHNPEKSLISLNDVIEKSLELHAYRLRVNNIEVETDLDPTLPLTMADFHQMQQICVNVVTNAEQAMTEAKSEGKISIRTVTADGFIRMEFSDDGPGIPEENLKRLFDPFFTTKGVGQGTGLGLSICYGIVEDHGGRIRAESTLGEGTTLVVEMPIVSADQATTGESASIPVDGHVQS